MSKKVGGNIIRWAIMTYVFLPIIIFFAGWCKIYISIPCILLMMYFIYKMMLDEEEIWLPQFNCNNLCKVLLALLIIVIWVYFSGIGGFVYQNSDHNARNGIFNILVEEEWPVVKTLNIDGIEETRGMIYYIGFWLPAALFAKIFGLEAGYFFQAVWAVLGVFIVFYFLCKHFGKVALLSLIGLIFFSGLDILGYCLVNIGIDSFVLGNHLEVWIGLFQYSSFTTQLFWVFNQAIYGWVLLLVLMNQRKNSYIVFIWSCGLLECTFPFVGMLPYVIYVLIRNCARQSSSKDIAKGILSEENILGGGIIGLTSFAYLMGNTSGKSIESAIQYGKGYILCYILFLAVEIGIYAFIMYPYQKKNILFWITLSILIVCPFIRVGSSGDFCMRASIPALLVLLILLIEAWQKSIKEKNIVLGIGIAVIFAIGSITPISEIKRTVVNTKALYSTGQKVMTEPWSLDIIMSGNNFSGNIDENLFFEYLGRSDK